MARNIQDIVEEQIGRWRSVQEQNLDPTDKVKRSAFVITIAHEMGAWGAAIAQRVGELLQLTVFDREILEHIASNAKVSLQTVETLSERTQGRIDDILTALVRERNFDHSDYMRQLSRTVAALWQHGPCVMVGHGCVHIVPRSHALKVRITAPEAMRITRTAAHLDVDWDAAKALVIRTDAERDAFHRRYFGVIASDCQYYDLVINTATLDVESAASILAKAYQQKFAGREEADVLWQTATTAEIAKMKR